LEAFATSPQVSEEIEECVDLSVARIGDVGRKKLCAVQAECMSLEKHKQWVL